ncbi:DUF2986 domain-containing protein [Vibrio sp. SM6]|uniref:DUF2986 domain-containing protein n=1 Tax=Vibrio agarilyticus TaxID=2726741 RepID=A0A7X8TUK8_9VIBR|nr:DUF2986 domain-containing protein [Vibrio agarilyticus]NLS14578.1 DUF2986 domain-containing protein [Vibrio agarilyticus]
MNRKKRINQILKAKQKKQNSKLHKSNKPRYVSKAERAQLEAQQDTNEALDSDAQIESIEISPDSDI